MFKPFKAPSFLKKSSASARLPNGESAPKRRRTNSTDSASSSVNRNPAGRAQCTKSNKEASRTPLAPRVNSSNPAPTQEVFTGDEAYYNVLWRKPTNKKNKTWDSDGILRVTTNFAYLQDLTGKELGRAPSTGAPLLPGSGLKISGREVEVESILSQADYLTERQFLAGTSASIPVEIPDGTVAPNLPDNEDNKSSPDFIAPRLKSFPEVSQSLWKKPRTFAPSDTLPGEYKRPLNVSAKQSLASQGRWKNPVKDNTILPKVDKAIPIARHDPAAADAIVMTRPPLNEVPAGKQIVDVVVDPILSRKLREHQKEGVKFLYNCVMGFQSRLGNGGILADEMGLGKTLQTIALIWTLLKQNPISGDQPVIRKALIVCPVTLIKNWRKEFRKWLGSDRIGVFVAEDSKTRITDFTRGRSYSVMIIGYERLRSVYEELQKGHGIDLIVADEGHRLKTAQSKSAQAIQALPTPKRIILSGTPIQNDLGEFFSMVDFVNPGALGTTKSFARNFERPIEKSRQPDATEKEVEKGNSCGEELADTTKAFILRRTADVLAKYLPPKTESVLICKPTGAQAAVYKHVLASPVFQSALGSAESVLQLITILKKVCNSPQLLAIEPAKDPEKIGLAPSVVASIPAHLLRNASASSKLRVLDQLLTSIQQTTSEKVIIVSNFTSTLDLLGQLLTSQSMPFLRLDGSTPTSKRQDLVDTFNRTDSSHYFAFLLSAKAGGMGLNLIGASRLILFDVDWNPAVDAQAMARIHRDGQKNHCYIYRLLLGGALDEKIWQRQVTKLGLASSVLDSKSGQASFSREELKDLFRLDEGMRCQTHDLIGCKCHSRGDAIEEAAASDVEALEDKCDDAQEVHEVPDDESLDATDSEDDVKAAPSRHSRRSELGAGSNLNGEPRFIKSSELNVELQERLIRDRREAARNGTLDTNKEIRSLMAYRHIDTALLREMEGQATQDVVADSVLSEVLGDEDNLISFIFSKTSSCL